MLDELSPVPPKPTAERPLAGLTVLAVEDSRYVSEALRLLCVQSGARMRRADCLASAHKHLRVYRPSAVIVDLGLPDGPGEELIADLAAGHPPGPAIIGLSGDAAAEPRARAAGADGFLAKPIDTLAGFQRVLLNALPPTLCPSGPRRLPTAAPAPDPASLNADLQCALALIGTAREAADYDYLAHFLEGLALSAHDGGLTAAATALRARRIDEGTALLKRRI